MTVRCLQPVLVVAALALAGCDDVLVFDVAPDGRLLVACDAAGRAAAVGDGKAKRCLAWVDPTTGEATALTRTPRALAWPRALPEGAALAIEDRTRLVRFDRAGQPTEVLRGERRLVQPTPSPDGARVALLEVERLGLPGTLRVHALADGRELLRVDGALPGFAWAGDVLVAGVARGPREEPWSSGPGALVALKGGDRRVLHEGELAAVVWVAPGRGGRLVCTLPAGDTPLGLARVELGLPAPLAGEATGVCDLWPALAPDGRLLFTRAAPEEPSLEGALRLAHVDDLATSSPVPTETPASAPRWVGPDRVAYVTPDDHLVLQGLDGQRRIDLTARLRAACFGDGPP